MLDNRDHSIIAQNAARAAAVIHSAEIARGTYDAFDTARFEDIRQSVYGQTVALIEMATAVDSVKQAFPGTQTVPQVPAGNTPPPPFPDEAPAQAPQAPAGFGAPPPATEQAKPDVEALWREYFSDPSKWWDNRADKSSPNAPDFKKKIDRNASADEKRNAPALWINGRVPTPKWVKDALGAF